MPRGIYKRKHRINPKGERNQQMIYGKGYREGYLAGYQQGLVDGVTKLAPHFAKEK